MKWKLLLQLLILLFSINCVSQFSKTHYIPPLSNSSQQDPLGQYLYISCPSVTPVSFTIQEVGGSVISGTVTRDNPYIHYVGAGTDTQLLIDNSEVGVVKNNKGYIVEAADLIYVTVRLTATQNFQAGGLVSKGKAALGTQFRVGGFLNQDVPSPNENHYTFVTVLATENNTTVTFSDIETGVTIVNNPGFGNTPPPVVLNAGESYCIAVQCPGNANRDGLIGALVASDKPIAVNCGSFAGSNANSSNLDLGFDQIVSAERTGTDYIFIRGNGLDICEKPFVIAHEDNTEIFLNGNTSPDAILNAGDYFALDGTAFSANDNLYIHASKNVFAYQAIGSIDSSGAPSLANQNMHFLPPLSCQTPRIINNIPFINQVGSLNDFIGTVCVVTKTGATLDFIINGTNYTLAQLATIATVNGPLSVTGNPDHVTYTFQGLTGNISVFSSKQVYLSYYGSSGFATYGGFYSGFTFKPEVSFQQVDITSTNCIPNVELKVNSITGFDTFQWYFNGAELTGETNYNLFPTQPGYYKVRATLSECGIDYFSDEIPVSNCPDDFDADLANNNIDQDYDNDGITNCTESYGDVNLNLTNPLAGSYTSGTYTNFFTGTVTATTPSSPTPLQGNSDGSFVSEVLPGKGYAVTYKINYLQPTNIRIEYPASTLPGTDLINPDAEFVIRSNINKTITLLNPDNQLVVDTNFDGLYESNITTFSSFEIRFKLNGTTPLPAGTGTFGFYTYLTNEVTITHKNLSDSAGNRASFKVVATCVPKDSDNDGVPDQLDYDSDNDTIPDVFESQGTSYSPLSHTDSNGDGIDDIFAVGFTPANNDGDLVPNYLDVDSDNDGIFDIIESGSPGNSTNTNGISVGPNFGTNGLDNTFETTPNSGILNYNLTDTDGDGIFNYVESDSDNDGCSDILEAGFTDANNDGVVGDDAAPIYANTGLPGDIVGVVITPTGYSVPNPDYITYAIVNITSQPANVTTCELQSATFVVNSNGNNFQWEVSTDGGASWTILNNNATYQGVSTANLTVNNVQNTMAGYLYRVFIKVNGNACGFYSDAALLSIYPLPIITSPVTLVQCDSDTDGSATVNLTEKNNFICSEIGSTFTYYTTFNGANNALASDQIINPLSYPVTNATVVFVRVENTNGCYRVATLNVFVSATQIPASTVWNLYKCDDYLDATNNDYDGVAFFDLLPIQTAVQGLLPVGNYSITFYTNQTDAESEQNPITNLANYRNIGAPFYQEVWIRVDSNLDNACFGLGPFIHLHVERVPLANPVNSNNTIRSCDDDQDGQFAFDTSTITNLILNGQTGINVTYTDSSGAVYTSNLPNPFPVTNQMTVTAHLENNTTLAPDGPCFDELTFQFIVDDKPEIYPPAPSTLVQCDDETTNPENQDGIYPFDTTGLTNQLLNGQTGMDIVYTLADGSTVTNLPNPFLSATQNVLVTITNPINTSCPATATLQFIVNPLPVIDLEKEELVCTNIPTFFVDLDAAILDGSNPANYTYQWYFNGTPITGETNYTYSVNTAGTYTVQVTNSLGCSLTRTITVIASNAATINDIEIVDLTDANSVLVVATGLGDYVYAFDDSAFQESNLFENVPMGIHTVYVKDLNGCGEVQQVVHILGAPAFFTPNGDGYNDTWNIKGTEDGYLSNSLVSVFDRYGKLLKQFYPSGPGWNGTYNGQLMPADDYWFSVQFEDGRSAKGHFALKR